MRTAIYLRKYAAHQSQEFWSGGQAGQSRAHPGPWRVATPPKVVDMVAVLLDALRTQHTHTHTRTALMPFPHIPGREKHFRDSQQPPVKVRGFFAARTL